MNGKGVTTFIIVWLANSVVLFQANAMFPDAFELGNANLSLVMSGPFSGLILTLLCVAASKLYKGLNIKPTGRYTMFAFFWVVNAASIWLIARLAGLTGFGIVRFTWAIGLALFANLTQWIIRQTVKSLKLV